MNGLALAKWGAVALCAVPSGLSVWVLVDDPTSVGHRAGVRYCASLERKLHRMFVFRAGSDIALGQVAALWALVACAALVRAPWTLWLVLAVGIAAGPTLWLDRALLRRVRRIDEQVQGFLVAMANALKSRPAIGDAMASVIVMTPAPMRQELELAVKQMTLGATVEQALLHMSSRVRCGQLSTALSAILIGRHVGGNLPALLETTAAAMREMARLEGVVRTKTAEGKAQLLVLALFPFALMLGFNAVSPGYFEPLTSSLVGWIVTAVAFGCWGSSIVVARRILAVDL